MGYQLKYTYHGKSYTIKQLSKISGLSRSAIYQRIQRGLSVEEAVESPKRTIRIGLPKDVADEAYDFIVRYKIENDGIPPTYRMLSSKFDMSTSQVRVMVSILVKRGLVTIGEGGASRSIQVVGGKWVPPKKVSHAA